jgi:HlyD family type I secretion membrane fusion protein
MSNAIDITRDNDTPVAPSDWRYSMRVAYVLIFGCLGAFVLWASIAQVDSATIAPGVLATEGNRRTVQHLEGGIVLEILVKDGQRVAQNDILVRLDPTRIDTQNDLYANQSALLRAQEARLLAEFNFRQEIAFPAEVTERAAVPAVSAMIADQQRLFGSRRDAVARNLGIADSQIEQIRKETEQVASDIQTARATLVQVNAELSSLQPLFRQQLVPMTRIAPLERERLRLTGFVNSGEINLKKLNERLAESQLKRQQVEQDYKQEASVQLSDIRRQISDVGQQLLLAGDLQKRAEIRAPIAGVVQQLRIFTAGGVIRPGDPILDIAPDNEGLVIKARVNPDDADRVANGMAAEIRFPGFRYWGNTVTRGIVRSVSRDRVVENAGKDVYFAADVVVDAATIPPEIRSRLTAGLAADTIIVSGERTVAAYLLQPVTERFARSMRER